MGETGVPDDKNLRGIGGGDGGGGGVKVERMKTNNTSNPHFKWSQRKT